MLDKRKKYLQIALNGTLHDAAAIIRQIPLDERIIIEAGTPLIKRYGSNGIRAIRSYWEERIFGFRVHEVTNSLNVSSLALHPVFNMIAKSLEKNIQAKKRLIVTPPL